MRGLFLAVFVGLLATAAEAAHSSVDLYSCADCDRFLPLMVSLHGKRFPERDHPAAQEADMSLCRDLPGEFEHSCKNAIKVYGLDSVLTLASAAPEKLCSQLLHCHSLAAQRAPAKRSTTLLSVSNPTPEPAVDTSNIEKLAETDPIAAKLAKDNATFLGLGDSDGDDDEAEQPEMVGVKLIQENNAPAAAGAAPAAGAPAGRKGKKGDDDGMPKLSREELMNDSLDDNRLPEEKPKKPLTPEEAAKKKEEEEKKKEEERRKRIEEERKAKHRKKNEAKIIAGETMLRAEATAGEVSGTGDITRVMQVSNMLSEPACGDLDDYDCQTSNLSVNSGT